MSIKIMSRVWELSQINAEINRDDKFLLLALADHANDDGECYPSLSKIQKKCFFSKQGLLNSMDRVIKIGYVSKNKRKRENGSNTSNLYQFHEDLFSFKIEEAKLLEAMKKLKNTNTTQVVNGVDKGGLPRGLGVVHDVDKDSLPRGQLYEPSINHHYESSFNLSLERVDLKTFRKQLIEFCPNFKFSIAGKLGYSNEHSGFCLKSGYIHSLHTGKLVNSEESLDVWQYLYEKKIQVFEQAAIQNNQKSAS